MRIMTHLVTIYGISQCDSVRKARKWFVEQGREYAWYDFKKHGVSEELLLGWSAIVGWEVLLNKRGTTWRKLDVDTQESAQDCKSAIQLMAQHTSLIKRPVIDWGQNNITVGFQPEQWIY